MKFKRDAARTSFRSTGIRGEWVISPADPGRADSFFQVVLLREGEKPRVFGRHFSIFDDAVDAVIRMDERGN